MTEAIRPTFLSRLLKSCAALLAVVAVVSGALYWFYGIDTSHEDGASLWPGRIRSLTPPTATGVTLQRDLLDHYATYVVAEEDLTAFLDERFGFGGHVLDSYSERKPVDPSRVGTTIGRLHWLVAEGTVVYSYAAENGGVSTYYHDPSTGRTYQSSAHW